MSDFVTARYLAKPSVNLEKAARILANQDTASWTPVGTASPQMIKKYEAKTGQVDAKKHTFEVLFPTLDFDARVGGIPSVIALLSGVSASVEELEGVRLLDVEMPKDFIKQFKGPNFGVEGLRKLLGTSKDKRLHVGTVVRPKIGLSPKQTAEVAFEAAVGGIDFVKDDESLASQSFCPLQKRVEAVIDFLDKAKKQTGKNTLYACNITSTNPVETAELALKSGANCLMLNPNVTGYGTIQLLTEQFKKIPLYVHRPTRAALNRDTDAAVDMLVLCKMARLAGADMFQVGNFATSKAHSTPDEMAFEAALLSQYQDYHGHLRRDFSGLKQVMPVISGGLRAGSLPEIVRNAGTTDIAVQANTGVHDHPFGTRAGATAMLQAAEAIAHKVPLEKYAETRVELSKALEKWGAHAHSLRD